MAEILVLNPTNAAVPPGRLPRAHRAGAHKLEKVLGKKSGKFRNRLPVRQKCKARVHRVPRAARDGKVTAGSARTQHEQVDERRY